MNLYIETENGAPKNHPAFEDNILEAFNCIPENWKPFVRVERPVLGEYELFIQDKPTYEIVNGVWTDVWHKRDMTTEEKATKDQAAKQNEITVYKTGWAKLPQRDNFSAWVFDEATCSYQPPIPRPAPVEGKIVFWCGAENNWKEAPARPEGEYKFDFLAWQWVPIVN